MDYKSELAKVRKAKKIKIPDLCKQTGISLDTYKSYEYRGAWPSKENLLRIAQCLNASLDEIVGYNVTPATPESYCKQHGLRIDVMEKGNTLAISNRHTVTEKQILIPAGKFQKLAAAAKEKAAPLSAEIEAALFMVLAQCEQDQLTEQAANNMAENAVNDLGRALLLRDDKIIKADFSEQREMHKAMRKGLQPQQLEKSAAQFIDQEIGWRDKRIARLEKENDSLHNRIKGLYRYINTGRNEALADISQEYETALNERAAIKAENTALKELCINLLQKHVLKDKGANLTPAAALAVIETELKKRIGGK